ncbi:hypothetical protein B9479_007663 [Cryptococcus floricola]|uniref:Uncharacterized protein n=1 Tax=Cryptococcus floricola TaxID=2591691 RepID=A0A5D3ANU2_9TREE|nr:hypothetical protein B9479_007663 [Cryptococcus floricola]
MRFFALFTATVPLLSYALAAPLGGPTIPPDTREASSLPARAVDFTSILQKLQNNVTSVPSLPGNFSKEDASALLDTLKGSFESAKSESELTPSPSSSSAKRSEKLVA